jgi:hypothetical protein
MGKRQIPSIPHHCGYSKQIEAPDKRTAFALPAMLDAGLHTDFMDKVSLLPVSVLFPGYTEKVSLLIKGNYCRPDDFRASIEAPKLPRLLDRLLEG